MPAFAYTGLNAAGKSVKGIETAESVASLRAAMKNAGVYLTAVTEATGARASSAKSEKKRGKDGAGASFEIDLSRVFGRIPVREVGSMTRLLSTMLVAGVTLPEALAALVDQTTRERFKGVLSDLASRVNEGSSMADAVASHPHVFPPLYVNMVRAGESSGALETVLIRLADYMEQQEELRGKVSGAMVYPVVMALVGAGVVALLMVKVVPQISMMFEDQGAELPFATRLMMTTSELLSSYWWVLLALFGAGTWLFRRWRQTEAGRKLGDSWILRTPLVGELARKLAIARFARTLATMLASGVPLLDALDIVRGLLGNAVLEGVVSGARDEIREGQGIALALKRSGYFPPLVTQMIAVGERSGQLEEMLSDLAKVYDREAAGTLEKATQALAPMMIVVMGVVVGFIMFAIMTPIMEMNQMIGR
ncbi:MAG: type II secretion system protein GspF [Myxococcales bacterium FL481]|nr:MAG: type II secretion system protein GspF [Myxococcales bacterium FL481]